MFHQQLFGDEAFYWLEGQYLAWSYSELPGWTAWMIRLGTEIFGNNYFAVRIVSYLGFLSIFRAVWVINHQLSMPKINQNVLLLAMPIFVLLAVMALPDIWLLFFVIWIVAFFIKAINSNKISAWVILGLVIAASINVHVRMWMWLFVSGVAFLWIYRQQQQILKPLILITLPIALLGFLPILWFNFNHEFALFEFQFGRRHPWQLQLQNISFVLSQLLVVTPLVFLLWFKNTLKLQNKPPIIKWILLTAILHWFLYVFLSLFADGLRTTVHWLLISYLPVLAISYQSIDSLLRKWAVISGLIISLGLLLTINIYKTSSSNIQARLLDNSTGWHELSLTVTRLQKQQAAEFILADNFMTAAELAFEMGNPSSIKVLPHAKNIKHGRQKQLQIMGLLLEKPISYKNKALLIVEDSTLKLQNKGKYYAQLCEYFDSMELLESLHIENSNKLFHIFKINDGNRCEIPALFYVQQELKQGNIELSGWVTLHNSGIQQLYVKIGDKEIFIADSQLENTGVKKLLPEILDPNYPRVGFKVTVSTNEFKENTYQIKAISNDNKIYFSQVYYLE
ncbi:MAG: glycosyltransferase family 39 protein [Proteobacteria bacterium]|nr:glycosyltransferase family 39 protein [Pseudomonadota bacterium]